MVEKIIIVDDKGKDSNALEVKEVAHRNFECKSSYNSS